MLTRRNYPVGVRGLIGMVLMATGLVAWILSDKPFNGVPLVMVIVLFLCTIAAFYGLGYEYQSQVIGNPSRVVLTTATGRSINNQPAPGSFQSTSAVKRYTDAQLRELRSLDD